MFHLPFYLDNAVGAHHSASSTTNASRFVGDFCRVIALLVDFVIGKFYKTLGACVNAKSAAFTLVGFKG